MNLDEIKTLTNEELGRLIAEKVGFRTFRKNFLCASVLRKFTSLCDDLNAVAEVEKIIIEKYDHFKYSVSLDTVLRSYTDEKILYVSHIAIMTARQRAEACLLTLQK